MGKVKPRGLGAVREALTTTDVNGGDPLMNKRRLVADLCRLLSEQSNDRADPAAATGSEPLPELSPRMRQTLNRLLAGDSEKQIARRLGVSRNTVHVYVKGIYRTFDVCSRGELLAKFIHARAD
jgi:DNA-binding CsgD family transcriptional regulator